MKNILILSMLVSFVMICSCQKKDSAAEQQLGQRKVELDAREEALAEKKSALDEREKTLDKRQKALDERERSLVLKQKSMADDRTNPTDAHNPAQVQAERERVVQQFSTGVPDQVQVKAEKATKEGEMQEQRGQSQTLQEEKLRAIESKWHSSGMSGGAIFPAPAASSSPPSPATEDTSPSPSPSPE